MLTPARDLCDLLEANASDGHEAFWFVKTLIDRVISTLRRDSRLHAISSLELEYLLADAYRDAETKLFAAMRDRVHLDDARDAVRRCVGEDQ
jgi:hypothetical protein